MDISGTITQITMDYIKPKKPIYKLKVFVYNDNDDELFFRKTYILEHDDNAFRKRFDRDRDDLHWRIDFDDAVVHTEFINALKEDENKTWYDGYSEIDYGAISFDRIA